MIADAYLTDPLGRVIVLHDRTWFGHVVKAHPEVTECRALAEAAIRNPEVIRHSRSDADCRLYLDQDPAHLLEWSLWPTLLPAS